MIQEDKEGIFTDLAMPQPQQPGTTPKHGLYVEFYKHAVKDAARTLEEGRDIHKEVDYVMIMVPGDKGSIVRRPIRTGQDPKHDNNRFHNEYVAYLQNKEVPVEGTMLETWPELNTAQVLDLQHLGIKTVEHLANLNDTAVQQYMGLVDLKQKAKLYVEAMASGAPMKQMEAALKDRDNQINSQANAIEEMAKRIQDLEQGK